VKNVEQAKTILNKTVTSIKSVYKSSAKRHFKLDTTSNHNTGYNSTYNEKKSRSTLYNNRTRDVKSTYFQYKTDVKSQSDVFTESLFPLRIVSNCLPKISNIKQNNTTNSRNETEPNGYIRSDDSLPKLISFKIIPADQFAEIKLPNQPKEFSNNSQIIKVSIRSESEILTSKQTRNKTLYNRSSTSKGIGIRKPFTRHEDRRVNLDNNYYAQMNPRKMMSLVKRNVQNSSLHIYKNHN